MSFQSLPRIKVNCKFLETENLLETRSFQSLPRIKVNCKQKVKQRFFAWLTFQSLPRIKVNCKAISYIKFARPELLFQSLPRIKVNYKWRSLHSFYHCQSFNPYQGLKSITSLGRLTSLPIKSRLSIPTKD